MWPPWEVSLGAGLLSWSGRVGEGGVVGPGADPLAFAGDEHFAADRAHSYRGCPVVLACRAVVAGSPQPFAGCRAVGDRAVVLVHDLPAAVHLPGDEHRAPDAAHGYGLRVAVVALDPHLGTGGGAVRDGGVVLYLTWRGPDADAGNEHFSPGRADGHRTGAVVAVASAVVASGPRPGAGDRVVANGGVVVLAG